VQRATHAEDQQGDGRHCGGGAPAGIDAPERSRAALLVEGLLHACAERVGGPGLRLGPEPALEPARELEALATGTTANQVALDLDTGAGVDLAVDECVYVGLDRSAVHPFAPNFF
jgi:hypothetical protein